MFLHSRPNPPFLAVFSTADNLPQLDATATPENDSRSQGIELEIFCFFVEVKGTTIVLFVPNWEVSAMGLGDMGSYEADENRPMVEEKISSFVTCRASIMWP